MEIKTDIEIAQAHEMEKITEIAAKAWEMREICLSPNCGLM